MQASFLNLFKPRLLLSLVSIVACATAPGFQNAEASTTPEYSPKHNHKQLRVVIDPGHGGEDPGAKMPGLTEADLALSVAKKLKAKLEKNLDFITLLTRESNQNLNLQNRVQLAESFEADLFISIHANSSPDPRAKGVQFYFQNQLPADEETLFLARQENLSNQTDLGSDSDQDFSLSQDVSAIVSDLKRQVRFEQALRLSKIMAEQWRKTEKMSANSIRQAPFYVISKNKRPSVLIELGFLTNTRDAAELISKPNQELMAERIYRALIAYQGGHQIEFPLD